MALARTGMGQEREKGHWNGTRTVLKKHSHAKLQCFGLFLVFLLDEVNNYISIFVYFMFD